MRVNNLAVISVVGGKGTRLYPLSLNISKPIIDMCNKAVLARMLEPLVIQGCREIIIASKGYDNAAQLNKYFKGGEGFFSRLGVATREEFKYQPNYDDKGSGDAVRYCMEYYDLKKNILVIGGDNIADIDLDGLITQHEETNALLTVVLKELGAEEDVSQFGVAVLGDEMRIQGFVEKPGKENAPSRLINAGIYVFSPEIRHIFRKMGDRVRDIGGDVIPYLVREGYPVYGYLLKGYWADVGTPGRFLRTTLDILQGKIKNIALKHRIGNNIWVHPSTVKRNRGSAIRLRENVLIGRNCTIGDGVMIENSSIGHTCMIGEGSVIKNSVIMSFVNIGRGVRLNRCILGRFTTVEDGSIIDADLDVDYAGNPRERVPVIGGGGVRIFRNSIIGPGKRVAPIKESHRILSTGKFIELGMDRENIYFAEK